MNDCSSCRNTLLVDRTKRETVMKQDEVYFNIVRHNQNRED